MLLDTHVLLWIVDDHARLGAEARRRLTSAEEVLVSAASLWELAIKVALGKVAAPNDLPGRIAEAGLGTLAVTAPHAWLSRAMEGLPHRDPFDRLLVTQAAIERLPFVTADRALLGSDLSPRVELVDARV
ncbi:MAG TPA: type II toxin-antitoxin system VapC family toxin [Intrasporangium sp.]|uniref:type II toxin-antitoxin system VapC family toxin n=1 Tax=Intrasporangium sp. TaxID=1925024 RepID=UPI002D77D485|nr:type II toxin-antitoxin system VapC family toxin [Intrasporangium sp.]HET7398916.1 type II toxin-antitoxin system VapC family toxin [Intrasporangium sp.]